MNDRDTKQRLPIDLVLKNGEYAHIKTSTKLLVGHSNGEPVAEKTKFGWVIMSPHGIDFEQADFDSLCRLDVLGLENNRENDQTVVYVDFKEQLARSSFSYYEVNLP